MALFYFKEENFNLSHTHTSNYTPTYIQSLQRLFFQFSLITKVTVSLEKSEKRKIAYNHPERDAPAVTKHAGAHPRGTLVNDPTINAERSRSLFTTFQPWESLEHLTSEPSFPMRPSTSHAPHKATSQKHPPKFPMFLWGLNPAAQTVLQSVWEVPHSPSSHGSSLLQDLGHVAISLRILMQKGMCDVTLDHGEIQERHRP